MLVISVAVALVTTLIFMIMCRPLAISLGMIDRPGGRKTHDGDVPIVGGAAMFMGLLLGTSLLPDLAEPFRYLAVTAGLLVFIGILDDRFGLPASVRLATQVLVVVIMAYGGGLMIRDIGNTFGFGTVSFGPFSLLFTVLVTCAGINAFNMIDGIDGLAGSMALVTLTAVVIVSGAGTPAFQVAGIAIAAIVPFLLFNFPMLINKPLRSFMGDGGSTMLGLVIAWVMISVNQGEGRVVTPVITLWFASIPIYDLFTLFVRRLLNGKSPFTPGHDHCHHVLLSSGMKVRQTLVVLTGLQAFYVCIGLAAHFFAVPDILMFSAWAILGISHHRIIAALASAYRQYNTDSGDALANIQPKGQASI